MKNLIRSLILLSLAPAVYGSWPFMKLNTDDVQSDPSQTLAPVLQGHQCIYFSSPDFRDVTIKFSKEKKEFSCRFPVSYVKAFERLDANHEDIDGVGWTLLPAKINAATWEECPQLGLLLAILDHDKIDFKRMTSIRHERKTDQFLAAWNYLQFNCPLNKKDSLIRFLSIYLRDFPPKTSIPIYNRQS